MVKEEIEHIPLGNSAYHYTMKLVPCQWLFHFYITQASFKHTEKLALRKLVFRYQASRSVTSFLLLDFSQGDPVQHQVRVRRPRVRARVGERPEGIRTGLHLEDLQVIWNVPKILT